MNSILFSFEDDEKHFDTYCYINNCFNSPYIKTINNNIGKEEFYDSQGNFKDNSYYAFIEKTAKALSKCNNKDFQKEEKEKKNINIDDNYSLFNIKEENENKNIYINDNNSIFKINEKNGNKNININVNDNYYLFNIKEQKKEKAKQKININDNYSLSSLIEEKEEKEEKEQNNINIDDNFSFLDLNEGKDEKGKKEKKEENLESEKSENLEMNEKNEKKERKKCGRKRLRNNDNQNVHNKYADDNLRRKIKHIILKNLLIFLNNEIKRIYNGNIGDGIFKKELQTINQSQKSDATINFNKEFLTKQISDIFSDKISGRFTNYPPYHNKRLIIDLLNEKDENKKIFFRKLFSLNFNDCLMHFRGEIHNEMLEGLTCFKDIKNEIINKYDDGIEYYNQMKYYLDNYEKIINKKRARRPRKKVEK